MDNNIIKFNDWAIIEEHIQYIDNLKLSINENKINIESILKKTFDKYNKVSKVSFKKILRYTFIFLLSYTSLTNIKNIIKNDNIENKETIEVIEEVVEDIGFKNALELEVSENGINLIKDHEKLKLKAYSIGDGMITIGYGHAERIGKSKYKLGQRISEETANMLFEKDLKNASDGVKRIFKQWSDNGIDVQITQDMFDSLVSMTFNSGIGNIRKSDFIQHLKKMDYIKAGETIKTFAVSKKFKGLEKRRKDESKLFLSIF